MSDGDINLAALWVPVMAETSKIKGQLSEAGTEGAREFARNFNTETQSLIEKGFNSAMRSSFTKAGRDAFNDFQKSFQPQQGQGKFQEFGHKAGEGVLDGLRGSLLTGGVAGITAALTEAFLSGFEHLAEGATEVFDKIIEGAEEVVHKVIEVGEQFEKIEHQILEFSTASGEGFENLRLSATTVLGEIDTKGDDLGKTMAVLSQRLGLEAGPALEDLTRHVEELGDRFGRIDVEGFTGALAQLGVKGEDADGVLASWTQSAREAGITVNDIVGVMPQMGEALSQVGLNAQQSGALVSEWAQKSLPLNKVLTGFSTAEKVFAEKNMDFKSGLVETAKELQHFKDIGDQKDYQKLAETVFGPRNWTIAQAAIQQLLDVLGRAPNAFDATGGSVDDLTQHTQTLGNKWQQVQNQIKTALAPLGGAVLAGLGSALDALGNYVKTHHDQIVNWIKDLGDKFIASIPTFQKWAVDLIEIFRAVYQVFANMAAGFLETFGKMLAGTGQLLDKLPAAFKKLIPGGQDEINAMKDFGKGMLDAGKSIVDADIGGKLETLRGKIQALNPDLDTLKSKWNSTVDTMTTGQSLDALSGANINQLGAAPGGAGGGRGQPVNPSRRRRYGRLQLGCGCGRGVERQVVRQQQRQQLDEFGGTARRLADHRRYLGCLRGQRICADSRPGDQRATDRGREPDRVHRLARHPATGSRRMANHHRGQGSRHHHQQRAGRFCGKFQRLGGIEHLTGAGHRLRHLAGAGHGTARMGAVQGASVGSGFGRRSERGRRP